ncbi:VOC family protein [Abyssisolibacter fermentans]|uniref:VOC family protein n=1 Tax=Abyssisolibacter fermentans TaxID=1766203 RepID=UPI0008314828|nr:VOC family protein [Abyssisolibacter fermentans]
MYFIDHINRYVSNVDKFIVFYRDVLEYELIDKGIKTNGKRYAILKGRGHELFISEREDFTMEKEQNFRHIGYYVENADELFENLKLKGYIKKELEIIEKPFSRQFYIKDPDGFEIDLIQWTDKQRYYNSLKNKNCKN